jgi:vacuolar-type H+-ATPase subunit I/STV1
MGRRKINSVPFSLFAFQDIITSVTGIILLITMMMAVELVQNMQRAASAPQEQKSSAVEQTLRGAIEENSQEIVRLERLLEETTTIRFDADALRRRLANLSAATAELEKQTTRIEATQQEIEQRTAELAKQSKDLTPEAVEELAQEQREMAQQIEAMRQANRVIFNRPEGAAKTPWLVQLNADGILAAEMGARGAPQTFASAAGFLTWVGGQNNGAIYFVILVKPDSIETFAALREELQGRQFEVGYDLLRADQTAIDPNTGAGAP